eukprot:scaffold22345_cov22-Cyclotella_meneghiniana.AAC.1
MGKPPSPVEYIHSAIQLHLNAIVKDSASLSEIDAFLSSPDNNNNNNSSNNNNAPDKLFVYVQTTSSADDQDEAYVSTSLLPSKTIGSLAFIRTSPSSAVTTSTLQCVLLSPRLYTVNNSQQQGDEDNDNNNNNNDEMAAAAAAAIEQEEGSASTTFANLQSFARHIFLPAVKSLDTEKNLTGLEDKLHELDVALGQYRRSVMGTVPTVVLKPHPAIAHVVDRWDGRENNIDGLDLPLHDDAFINEVQSTVNHWISSIRKVTSLTSAPFPSGDSVETESHADLDEISFWMGLDD